MSPDSSSESTPTLPTREELEELYKQSPKAVVAYAARCALRALPVVGNSGNLDFWPEEKREYYLRSVVTATELSLDVCFDSVVVIRSSLRYAAEAAAEAAKVDEEEVAANTARTAYAAANAAANTARTAYIATSTAAAVAAAVATYVATSAAGSATAAAASWGAYATNTATTAAWGTYAANTAAEFEQLKKGTSEIEIFQQPLWHGQEPKGWSEVEDNFRNVCTNHNCYALYEAYLQRKRGGTVNREQLIRDLDRWQELHEQFGSEGDESEATAPSDSDDAVDTKSEESGTEETPTEYKPTPIWNGGDPTASGDRPAEIDLLGREPFVRALRQMFMSPEQDTPLTLALLGDWGQGKSSVLTMVQKQIRERAQPDDAYDFAWFNAWEYEKTDSVPAALAHEVARGILDGTKRYPVPRGEKESSLPCWHRWRNWWNQLWLGLRFASKDHPLKLTIWIVIILVLFAFLSLSIHPWTAQSVRWIWSYLIPSGSDLSSLAVLAAAISGLYLAVRKCTQFLDDMTSQQVQSFFSAPSFQDKLGDIPLLKRQIDLLCDLRLGARREIWGNWLTSWITYADSPVLRPWLERRIENIKAWFPKSRRLIVYVDDLDRCHTECIVSTFDAVRLVMDRKDVIVVIAIDHRIALKAIAKHYEDLAGHDRSPEAIARDYLGKIIQIPIRLSTPHPTSLEDYLFNIFEVERQPTSAIDEASPRGDLESAPSQSEANLEPTPEGDEHEHLGDEIPSVRVAPPPEIEIPPREPIPEIDVIANEDAAEIQHFADLAKLFQFANPRRLKRLRNSYRLLKFIVQQHPRMMLINRESENRLFLQRILCWYEFLWQQKPKDRAEIERCVADNALAELEEAHTMVYHIVRRDEMMEAIRGSWSIPDLEEIVHAFILPEILAADGEQIEAES